MSQVRKYSLNGEWQRRFGLFVNESVVPTAILKTTTVTLFSSTLEENQIVLSPCKGILKATDGFECSVFCVDAVLFLI